jgi:hypothetical protein
VADDDPLSMLSPEERAYLRGGKPQQGASTAPATTPPPATTTAPVTQQPPPATTQQPQYSIFNPDPSGIQHAIETGLTGGMQTVLNAPSDWARRAGFNVGDLAGPNAPINVPALTPAEQAGQQAHPVWTGVGRFGGEALAAAPAIMGGEALLPEFGAGALASAGRGAIMGAGQNALTSAGSPDQPLWQQLGMGAGFGAGGGLVGGRIARAFGSDTTLASKAVQDAGKAVQDAGVDVLPENLLKGASATPGQIQQVNKAFGNKVLGGSDVSDFSASTLGGPNGLTAQVGNQISTAANQGQIVATPKFASDLASVVQAARDPANLLDDTSRRAILAQTKQIGDALAAGNGTITGQQFDNLTGAGSRLVDWMANDNKDFAKVAQQLNGTLRDGFQASSPPGVYGDWVDARTRFRLLKAIEDNVEHDPAGNIRPGSIMADVNRRFSDMPSQTGPGTVGEASDLARSVKTLFGGSGGPPGAAATGGGWISQHPALAAALGAGGAGGVYQAITNPATVGNVLSWGAAHLPAAGVGTAALGADYLLRKAGTAYQQSQRFANALIQRGTQSGSNALAAYMGAGAAAMPPDRR